MNNPEIYAEAETAWVLARASDPAVRALCTVAEAGVVRMAWLLGHCQGRVAGLVQAENVYANAFVKRDQLARSDGDARNDTSTRGEPLKPGQ